MEGVLGSYRIIKMLGQGGMGAVYLAEHTLLGRRAAIKVLQPALSANQDIVQRFFNEARAATAIADPGIVQIFDFGYDATGSAYIVMEFLEGEALDARISRFGRLAPPDALRILRQVSSSLHAAHSRGIIHRDLKPENIFLVVDREVAGGERAKLLDFGIAKLTGDVGQGSKTSTQAIMGTPMYMSPEQCRGAGYVDLRADLYSLGCVLFTMLVGRPPFEAEGVGELIAMHLREPAPPPSRFVPTTPPAVDALVLRCLAKSPDERYASAADLATAIDALLTSGAAGPTGPQPIVGGAGSLSAPSLSATTLSGSAAAIPAAGTVTGGAGSKRGPVVAIGAIAAVAIAVVVAVVASSGSGGAPTAAPASAPAATVPAATGSAAGGAGAAGAAPAALAPVPVPDAPAPVPAADVAATLAVDAGVAVAAEPSAPDDTKPTSSRSGSSSGSSSGPGSRSRKPKLGTTAATTRTTAPPTTAPPTDPKPVPPTPRAGVPGDEDGDGIPDQR